MVDVDDFVDDIQQLVDENTREQLDDMAMEEYGIDTVDLSNKTMVATLIIEARIENGEVEVADEDEEDEEEVAEEAGGGGSRKPRQGRVRRDARPLVMVATHVHKGRR